MKRPNDTLSFGAFLGGVLPLIPRLPSILKFVKTALAIGTEDHQSVGKVIEETAAQYGNSPALYFEDQSWTYTQFNETINQYAHYLLSQGIKEGDTLVVYMENRPQMLFTNGAAAKIGAVASLVNPNQRSKVLLHSINIDKGSFFLIGEELVDAFEEVRESLELSTDTKLMWVKDTGVRSKPIGYLNFED